MPQRFIAGIDLGATNVRVAITDEEGEVLARRAGPYAGGEPEGALRAIGRTVDELVRGVWMSASVSAIGMALPGTVDPGQGTVASAANLPGWGDVPIARILGGERAVPVAVENDANAAVAGEVWRGAARGARHAVFIALGTGIGVGLWLDGSLYRGAHYLAGEVAFFRMTRAQLRSPGWDACLEGIVGGRALDARARELAGDGARAPQLFDAAASGNERAAAALDEATEYLAMATVDMIALLDPDIVVFGGGVAMAQGESLLGRVRELVHRCTPVGTPIVLSQLGTDAQILGAVKLAADRLGSGT